MAGACARLDDAIEERTAEAISRWLTAEGFGENPLPRWVTNASALPVWVTTLTRDPHLVCQRAVRHNRMDVGALVAALTPSEAASMVRRQTVDEWCEAHGLTWSVSIQSAVFKRSLELEEVPPPPPPDPRRRDSAELQRFVARAPDLPLRIREVAMLCLDRGLTLDQCAAQLGIKRETVRVHLRRLRAIRRRSEHRDQGIVVR
jgi:DNA-binding CsgD family transcriptional regulator